MKLQKLEQFNKNPNEAWEQIQVIRTKINEIISVINEEGVMVSHQMIQIGTQLPYICEEILETSCDNQSEVNILHFYIR